jgi:hypothetical protein
MVNTFQIKYKGKTLRVRRQERDEIIGVKSLQLFNGVSKTDAELRHCGGFKPSRCVGDPVSLFDSTFDSTRLYVEVVSVFYPGESTDEDSETKRSKGKIIS